MKQLLSQKLKTGLSINQMSYTLTRSKTNEAVYTHFGGGSFFVKNLTSGSGLTKYIGQTNAAGTVFLGYCEVLKTYVLRFSGEEVEKSSQNFVENFLLPCTVEEIGQDVRLTSVEAIMIAMPGNYSTPEAFMNAIQECCNVQQKTVPKVEVKQGTLYVGGKSGNNSIRVSALKSPGGNLESIVMVLKAKGPVAEKIGNLLKANAQSGLVDVIAFHILTTLNSISSTSFLELFKKDFMKLYAVGSILLQQNTEKQVFSGSGQYVSRSLKSVLSKLYSSTHSAEVQELVVEWLHTLIVNQKFIKNGGVFINSLKALLDEKTVVPTESEKPVEPKASKRRTARKAAEDKTGDAS
jgi:hypothetical protein